MNKKDKAVINKLIFHIICCDSKLRKLEGVKPESDIVNDLGADSLDSVEIIMALEEEFSMSISDADADTIKTLQDVYDFIDAYYR